MKMKIRYLVLVFAVILSFTACSKKEQPAGTQTVQTDEGAVKSFKLSYIVVQDLAMQESYTTKTLPEMLKKFGYDIQIEMRSLGTHDGGEWDQKFQLEVASGANPPDICQLGGSTVAVTAAQAGWFAPISEAMVEKYIPRYYKQVNDIYDKMWAWGKDPNDGQMYGIPSFNMFGPNRHTLAYRADWLQKFNMSPPVTMAEFEEWLRKCRTMDPNGNGRNDEYGYTSQDDVWFFSEVFGAYGIMPQQWMLRDGKVVRGDVLPEMKDALRVLKDWYDKDLLPKGILTTSKRDQDFYSGMVGTMGQAGGYAPAIVPSGSYTAALAAQNPGASIIGAPSFKGPSGIHNTWEWGPRKYMLLFGSHLKEEQIGTIMQMFETIAADKELFELTMLGKRGLHWEFMEPSKNSGATVFLEPYTEHNKKLTEVGVREMSESAWCPIWLEDIYKDYLDPLAFEYAHQNPGLYDVLLSMPTKSSPLYLDTVNKLTRAYCLDVITGKKSLDSTFDSFVKEWMAQGGEILTKEANEMYDLMFR